MSVRFDLRIFTPALFTPILALGIAACAVDDPPAPDDGEPYVSQTIVERDASGQLVSHMRIIPRSQATAEFETARTARTGATNSAANDLAPHVVADPGCAPSSIWLFDEPDIGGNMLCLKASAALPDQASLAMFPRCTAIFHGFCVTGTWSKAIRSYSGGSDPFYFIGTGPECKSCRLANSYSVDTLNDDGCALRGITIGFGSPSCTPH